MNGKIEAFTFYSKNIHLDDGELAAGEVTCIAGEPLELTLGSKSSSSVALPENAHIALGRFDPHVHFRESLIPTREEFETHCPSGGDYEATVIAAKQANKLYSVRSGCLAALKGGVSCVGAMGNTPWGPVGPYRHAKMQERYSRQSLIPIVVWPRMEPNAPAIPGHEGKDFGSTFGGSGLTGQIRLDMYKQWSGQAVSYHNDQARKDENLQEFKERVAPEDFLLHHEYFNGDTVLACQKETIEFAIKAGIKSLLSRHIPTGPALDQLLGASKEHDILLPTEIGLDYMYWSRDRLKTQSHEIAMINYRRPAHPSAEDQQSLIELTRDTARSGYSIFFGTDHAPHPKAAKTFKNGLPGAPGTRNIEHSLQFYLDLQANHGYTWHDIDLLASINPAKHMAQYFDFPYEVGTMKSGAMANLTIFDPTAIYQVDEASLATQLEDLEYHSAMNNEAGLRGQTLYTISNGIVFDVQSSIKTLA